MKITILQENLAKGISLVSRSVSQKATLPILSNLLLSTDNGQLKLAATNLEIGINVWVGAKVDDEGGITIPAKILTELISSLPAEKIEIEVIDNMLNLKSGSFKLNLNGLPSSEFPQIPSYNPKEEILRIKRSDFLKGINSVVFASAQDDSRPVLTGVLIRKVDGNLTIVATDGYRLSLKRIPTGETKLEKDLIIPGKTLTELSRLSTEKGDEQEIGLALASKGNQVIFSLPQIELSSRLIDGEYPDFEKIIPKEFTTKAIFDKEEFLKTVKVASIFAREQANIIKLRVQPEEGKIDILAETSQIGTNESSISAKIEGDPLEIAFNYRFLLDFLNSTSGEEITFEAGGPLSPGVFKTSSETEFLHVIMPVRIQA